MSSDQFHEAADIFPLDEEHLDDLADDIRKHGLQVPIERLDGKIIDGRRRYLASARTSASTDGFRFEETPMAFRPAADETIALVAEIMRDCHPELAAEGVTVNVLEAYTPPKEVKPRRGKPPPPPKPPRPPLWKDGLPCLALAKINSHEVRVEGGQDCCIKIDIEEWKKLPDGRRRALIDHELRHFLVVCDGDGNTKFDAQGRPKMRLRPHDHQIGVFLDVIDRHGWQATEALSLRDAVRRVKQLSFGWDEADEPVTAGAA